NRLDDDPRHQVVDVVEARGLDRAAEDVDEQQDEEDRLDREADEQVRLPWDPQQAPFGEDEGVRDPVAKRRHFDSSSSASVSGSVARPVRFWKTSSSVGSLTEMSSIAIPASSSRRTA